MCYARNPPLPAALVCRGIGLLGVKGSAGVSHFLCDLRHTPDADHYPNLMPWGRFRDLRRTNG
jgi:hypothetical protein